MRLGLWIWRHAVANGDLNLSPAARVVDSSSWQYPHLFSNSHPHNFFTDCSLTSKALNINPWQLDRDSRSPPQQIHHHHHHEVSRSGYVYVPGRDGSIGTDLSCPGRWIDSTTSM